MQAIKQLMHTQNKYASSERKGQYCLTQIPTPPHFFFEEVEENPSQEGDGQERMLGNWLRHLFWGKRSTSFLPKK